MLVLPQWALTARWPALLLFDGLLSAAILYKIPYTEIDWTAYMEQVTLFRNGERDYLQIEGGTGPLVYPGGHVMIYNKLYDWTNGGSIAMGQYIFFGVYMLTLAASLSVYKKARIPFTYCVLLTLSKRLHSIYLLRLFNDCFATLFAIVAIRLLQSRRYAWSTALFSVAVSVKMSALLYLPGVAVVLWHQLRWRAAFLGVPFLCVQAGVAWPFRQHLVSYCKGAFNFGRQFLYKWTVNWRFVREQVFASSEFAVSLLVLHVGLLSILATIGLSIPFSPRSVGRLVMTANLIGILCARSLHYQFYAWFYWTVPFLLADVPGPLKIVWLALEIAWNTFPSTPVSSSLSLVSLVILIISSFTKMAARNNVSQRVFVN